MGVGDSDVGVDFRREASESEKTHGDKGRASATVSRAPPSFIHLDIDPIRSIRFQLGFLPGLV